MKYFKEPKRIAAQGKPYTESRVSLQSTFRALRYRNYRLFFIGQGASLIGTWMQRVATAWLVYRMTNSTVLLGIVGFVGQIPTFLLSPLGGVLADQMNRRNILLGTQVLAMAQALFLAILVVTGAITVPWILVLNIILGLINAFDIAARQSFVVEMIENKEDLGNAIALNSTMFNAARLLGPSITGILIASTGEGVCFFVNAASYVVIIVALLAMNIAPRKANKKRRRILLDFKEGFLYITGSTPMRSTIALLAMVSLFGMPFQVLMPVFAKLLPAGGAHTLGFLMGATGLGALCGALALASRKSELPISNLIPVSAAIFGAGLTAFSISKNFWLSSFFLLITGFGMIVQMASSNTLLQILTDDDKRGRVMAFYAMAFMGMAPFGSLVAGGLAQLIGAPYTVMSGGVACIAGSLLFAKKIRSAKNVPPLPTSTISLKIEEAIEKSDDVTSL